METKNSSSEFPSRDKLEKRFSDFSGIQRQLIEKFLNLKPEEVGKMEVAKEAEEATQNFSPFSSTSSKTSIIRLL